MKERPKSITTGIYLTFIVIVTSEPEAISLYTNVKGVGLGSSRIITFPACKSPCVKLKRL